MKFNDSRSQAMAALFCAMVAARKSRNSLPEYLRILPVNPRMKQMALDVWPPAERE